MVPPHPGGNQELLRLPAGAAAWLLWAGLAHHFYQRSLHCRIPDFIQKSLVSSLKFTAQEGPGLSSGPISHTHTLVAWLPQSLASYVSFGSILGSWALWSLRVYLPMSCTQVNQSKSGEWRAMVTPPIVRCSTHARAKVPQSNRSELVPPLLWKSTCPFDSSPIQVQVQNKVTQEVGRRCNAVLSPFTLLYGLAVVQPESQRVLFIYYRNSPQ